MDWKVNCSFHLGMIGATLAHIILYLVLIEYCIFGEGSKILYTMCDVTAFLDIDDLQCLSSPWGLANCCLNLGPASLKYALYSFSKT